MYVSAHRCVHIDKCIHIQTYKHTHAYTHTHMCVCVHVYSGEPHSLDNYTASFAQSQFHLFRFLPHAPCIQGAAEFKKIDPTRSAEMRFVAADWTGLPKCVAHLSSEGVRFPKACYVAKLRAFLPTPSLSVSVRFTWVVLKIRQLQGWRSYLSLASLALAFSSHKRDA